MWVFHPVLQFVDGFISSPKAVLTQLLDNAFPTVVIPDSLLFADIRTEDEIEEIKAENGSGYSTGFLLAELNSLRRRSAQSRQNLAYVSGEGVMRSRVANYLFASDSESEDKGSQPSQSDKEEVIVNLEESSSSSSEGEAEEAKTPEEDTTQKEEDLRRVAQRQLLTQLQAVKSQLEAIRSRLRSLVETVSLPLNPLDELIDQLGGESAVAELTGRSHRILHHHPGVADSSTDYIMEVKTKELKEKGEKREVTSEELRLNDDYYYYERRGMNQGNEYGVNMCEKNSFQQGIKKIAIISEAASAGISLHSDMRVPNQAKRTHIILELPWSADKIIQQCGRSHRSNQRIPPDYVFLLSKIGGELRFVSTISKRLRALGALTQGSRKATGALDFSQFDFNSSYARKAVSLMLETIFIQSQNSSDVAAPYGETLYKPEAYPDVTAHEPSEKSELEAYNTGSAHTRLLLMRSWLQSVDFQREANDSTTQLFNRLLGLELFKQQILVKYLNEVGTLRGVDGRFSRRRPTRSSRVRFWTRDST